MGAPEKRRESDWGAATIKDIGKSMGKVEAGVYQERDRARLAG